MDPVVAAYLMLGAAGLGAFAAVGAVHPADSGATGRLLSVAVASAAAGACGIGGAVGAALLPGDAGPRALLGLMVGLALALPAGAFAWRLTRVAAGADVEMMREELLGASGVVVTPVSAERPGEVSLSLANRRKRVKAESTHALPAGATVFVVRADSTRKVSVESQTAPWPRPAPDDAL